MLSSLSRYDAEKGLMTLYESKYQSSYAEYQHNKDKTQRLCIKEGNWLISLNYLILFKMI